MPFWENQESLTIINDLITRVDNELDNAITLEVITFGVEKWTGIEETRVRHLFRKDLIGWLEALEKLKEIFEKEDQQWLKEGMLIAIACFHPHCYPDTVGTGILGQALRPEKGFDELNWMEHVPVDVLENFKVILEHTRNELL